MILPEIAPETVNLKYFPGPRLRLPPALAEGEGGGSEGGERGGFAPPPRGEGPPPSILLFKCVPAPPPPAPSGCTALLQGHNRCALCCKCMDCIPGNANLHVPCRSLGACAISATKVEQDDTRPPPAPLSMPHPQTTPLCLSRSRGPWGVATRPPPPQPLRNPRTIPLPTALGTVCNAPCPTRLHATAPSPKRSR